MTLSRSLQLSALAVDVTRLKMGRTAEARDRSRRRLVERLGLMHGLPQKIGQLLAFSEIENSDPIFTRLTENEPTLTPLEARSEVERQLGGPIAEFFATFEPLGISASIGQVHRATLHDGRTVAVKVQHPGIAGTVEHDLRALGWLTAPVGDLRRGFDMNAYRAEIGTALRRELDYREEAAAIARFGIFARSLATPALLPTVIEELGRGQLLVTTWLHGEHLAAARTWPLVARAALSSSLIEMFFKSVCDWGWLHADPHPGNYRFLHRGGRPAVGLLDFGCVKQVPPAIQSGVNGLISDALHGTLDTARAGNHFARIGFNPAVLARLKDKLPAIGIALCTPFITPGAFDCAKWQLRDRLGEILGPDHMTFRTAGPPEIIFILRSFQGLLHYLKILDAPVNWRESIGQVTSREIQNAKTQRPIKTEAPKQEALSILPPDTCPLALDTFPPRPLSSTLHILVEENGDTKVALIFGAEATAQLANLVPDDLRRRLGELSIDLNAIAADARNQHYAPRELFSLVDKGKTVRVWLE